MDKAELKPIIEALIFASDTPIAVEKLRQILETVSKKDIEESLEELQAEYDSQPRGFYMQKVANGLQFRTRPAYSHWLKKLKKIKPPRLTQPTLETLAIIAYKQPITKLEIEKIRGVDSGGIIKTLLEKRLAYIVGKKDVPGRPFMFGTTKTFLEVFGLDNLSSLPPISEIEALDDAKLPSILKDKISPESDVVESFSETGAEEGQGDLDSISVKESESSCDTDSTPTSGKIESSDLENN